MFTKYFGDALFWSRTLRLALPIALQNLLMSSFSLVDTIMIGQLGDVPLAAAGMAGQWSWLMSLVMFGLCSGSSVFIAQYWGVGDVKKIRGIYGILLSHMTLVSLIFFAVALISPEWVIRLFNDTPEVIENGAAYLRIAAFSYPAIALNNSFSTVLRSTENVKLPMYVSGLSTAANALLNWCLIFGKLSMPALGIRGAAIATVISAWLAPLLLLAISACKRNILIVKLRELFGFGRQTLFRFYKISSPVILNESLWGLGTMIYNMIFGHLGYENYVAVTILRTVEGIGFVFFIGLCNACGVMVGKSIGSGEPEQAKSDARRFALIVPLLSAVVGGTVILLRPAIITLFNMSGGLSDSSRAAAMGIFLAYGLELGLRNIPYITIVGIFRPGGDTLTGMKMDIGCVWFFALPLTALAAFVLKLPFIAVYAVMLLSEDVIKCVLCVRHFLSYRWIRPVTEQGQRRIDAASESM